MKSVLIAIQPYWVFLIIARLMGWNIPQKKTIEVRKDFPQDPKWNKKVYIYCSKNRKSFNRIPKEYQPFMEKFLGCVIGEFVCDKIESRYFYMDTDGTPISNIYKDFEKASCLKRKEIIDYILRPNKKFNAEKGTNWVYGWHISDLKIYNTPKELGEFKSVKRIRGYHKKNEPNNDGINIEKLLHSNRVCVKYFDQPPQSWGYVDEL